MGYNITIGEATIDADHDFDYIVLDAEYVTHPDAPDHDPYVKNGNSRSPGYSVWSDFCEDAGIYELFYGSGWDRTYRAYGPCSEDFHRETPLLSEHPGTFLISQKDADYVSEKLAEYKRKHPNAEPGFWDDYDVDNGKDPTLARLLWLEFWFRWAVENCENPVVRNT